MMVADIHYASLWNAFFGSATRCGFTDRGEPCCSASSFAAQAGSERAARRSWLVADAMSWN